MVCALIGEWSSQHTTAWLVAEGQRLRVPIAFPRDLPEVLESEQLATRGAWVDVALDDGAVGRGAPYSDARIGGRVDIRTACCRLGERSPPAASAGHGLVLGQGRSRG